MTKKYKIWLWVNVGVLVITIIYHWLFRAGFITELMLSKYETELFLLNIPFFTIMLLLIIFSWKKQLKYKLYIFLLLFTISLTSTIIRPYTIFNFIGSLLIIFPLIFMFRKASYLYVFPVTWIAYVFKELHLPGVNMFIAIAHVFIAVIAIIEIIKIQRNKNKPAQYSALTIPINIGMIIFVLGGIFNTAKLFSFNSKTIYISGAVIFSLGLLYTFLSLPKSNYVDWPQQWKFRYRNNEIIPALIFLIIMIISLTMENFFVIFNQDFYAVYEIDFNKAMPFLQ